jgi:hypothetical protein
VTLTVSVEPSNLNVPSMVLSHALCCRLPALIDERRHFDRIAIGVPQLGQSRVHDRIGNLMVELEALRRRAPR